MTWHITPQQQVYAYYQLPLELAATPPIPTDSLVRTKIRGM